MKKIFAGLCTVVLLSGCCGMGTGGCKPAGCGATPMENSGCNCAYPCHCQY